MKEGVCVDKNECKTREYQCQEMEHCVNLDPGYSCECNPGTLR